MPADGERKGSRSVELDLVITDARVLTMEAGQTVAEAVGVAGERIAWVGSAEEAQGLIGPETEVIVAGGRTLLPGFIDSHSHVRLGSNPNEVDLAGAETLEDLRQRIREHADAHPDHPWIEGVGWNYGAMPGGRLPTWEDLEGLTSGRPAFLLSYDAHNVWLNREAMSAFGIGRDTGALPFGHVQHRDDGEPTGFLTGFAVMGISRKGEAALQGTLPGYGREQQYERTVQSLDMAIGFGITTVVEPQNSPDDLWIFERARAEGRLRSRLVAAMFHPVGTSEAEVEEFQAARARLDDDRLRVAPIKLYIDDVIEPWTAAMLRPYANRPGERGELFWEPEDFSELLIDLERRGFQCHIHGTGDRGLRTALDAIEAARAANGPADRRHLMVHSECLDPADVSRFAALGVMPCMQPRHCAPEIVADWRSNVGPQRWRYAWAFRSLHESGAELTFSSDWNVAEMDPMVGIYTALTRANLDGTGAWIPEETLDLSTTLRAYTMGGARACFAEKDRGSIAVGKYADLVLLSADLEREASSDPHRVLDVHADTAIVGGEIAYRA
jgi:predicted amidohydrolase YtcJ